MCIRDPGFESQFCHGLCFLDTLLCYLISFRYFTCKLNMPTHVDVMIQRIHVYNMDSVKAQNNTGYCCLYL